MLLTEHDIQFDKCVRATTTGAKASAIFSIANLEAVKEAETTCNWERAFANERISYVIDTEKMTLTFTVHRAPSTSAGIGFFNRHLALNILALVLSDNDNIGSISDIKGISVGYSVTGDLEAQVIKPNDIIAKRTQYGIAESTPQEESSVGMSMSM
jgi:hypothetical protein